MEPKGTVRFCRIKDTACSTKMLSNEMKENISPTLFRERVFEATANDATSLATNQALPEMRRGHRRQHRLGFQPAEPRDHQPLAHR